MRNNIVYFEKSVSSMVTICKRINIEFDFYITFQYEMKQYQQKWNSDDM